MKNPFKALQRLGKPLMARLLVLVVYVSPDWFKRAMFVTSFYARFNGITEPTREAMEPLVSAMHLAKDPDALKIFTQYKGIADRETMEKIRTAVVSGSTETIRGIFLSIVNATPSCLMYRRKDDMVDDLIAAVKISAEKAV